MTDLPKPPNVTEIVENFLNCLRNEYPKGAISDYLRACVYEHLWREEADRIADNLENVDANWIKCQAARKNARQCAQRARELSQ